MSSANHSFEIFLPSMLTFPSCFPDDQTMIRSRKMLKRTGAKDILGLLQLLFEPSTHAIIYLDLTCSLVVEILNGAD